VTRETRAGRVIRFIETHCRVPEGKLIGQPIKLAAFQKKFIRAIFDNPRRATRRAYLSIARKNGKSALIAAIALAFVIGPEKMTNSQVIVGARSRNQAGIIFKLAAKMIYLNPDLVKLVRIIPSAKTIVGLVENVEFVAISAEAGTAHGLSPYLAILDEVGQVRGSQDDFIEAIETAQGAYDAPLLIAISTQAPSDADLFSQWLDDAARSKDPSIVSHVYAAPKERPTGKKGPDGKPEMEPIPVTDRKAWRAANPGLGIFRDLGDVETQAAKAKRLPSAENGFRNLILNQRVTRFTPFISPQVWGDAAGKIDETAFYNGPVWGGLDLSTTTDLTALVLVAKTTKPGGTWWWNVMCMFWTPEATLAARSERDRTPYDVWVRDGWLQATPGVAVDYEVVAKDIQGLTEGMDLREIAFDRHKIKILQRELADLDLDLPLREWGQGFISMGPAIDVTEIEFLNKRVRHGRHPVLTSNAAQAVIVKDAAGNRKLDKSKSTGRIDGMVSLAMAMGAALVRDSDDQGGLDDYLESLKVKA
jgi:phage terminase large subunit-like protein